MDETTRLYESQNHELTTKERLMKMLVSQGLFASDAEAIMALVIPKVAEADPQYQVTWDRPSIEYPDQMYSVLYGFFAKPAAKEWIAANRPNAWFKAMFE